MHISKVNFFQIIFKPVTRVILYTIEALNYRIKFGNIFVKHCEYNRHIICKYFHKKYHFVSYNNWKNILHKISCANIFFLVLNIILKR